MPQYNFKSRFAPLVESGEKFTTIRLPRKRPTVPSDTLYLFTGLRTKKCRLLRTEICTHVSKIEFPAEGDCFYLFGSTTPNFRGGWPASRLVKSEGFKNWEELIEFFSSHYKLPFFGEIIRWNPTL